MCVVYGAYVTTVTVITIVTAAGSALIVKLAVDVTVWTDKSSSVSGEIVIVVANNFSFK